MNKLYLSLMLAAVSITAFANETLSVDITKMTPDQLRVYQQLKQSESQALPIAIENLTPDRLDKYAQIGKAFGSAFKECWSAVSSDAEKFGQSPAGKWAMVLVSWKIMGQDAINLTTILFHWIIGSILLLIGIPFFIWLVYRNCVRSPIKVVEHLGLFKKKVVYSDGCAIHDDYIAGYGLCFLIFLAVVAAITFA